MKMNLNTADLAINVAIEKATEVTKAKFCIAVLDAGVNLVAFSRMDGGRVGTIDVAMKKVRCCESCLILTDLYSGQNLSSV